MTTISVTGHRTLSHSFDNVSLVFKALVKAVGASRVLTGMAVGFDQLVAYNCLSEEVPYEAIVPFVGQESMWPEAVKEGYSMLLEQAAKRVVVSTGGYAAWKMHARNGYLVNNAKILVAYLNPQEKTGGTASCVKLAESQKSKVVINIFPMVSTIEKLTSEEEKMATIGEWLTVAAK